MKSGDPGGASAPVPLRMEGDFFALEGTEERIAVADVRDLTWARARAEGLSECDSDECAAATVALLADAAARRTPIQPGCLHAYCATVGKRTVAHFKDRLGKNDREQIPADAKAPAPSVPDATEKGDLRTLRRAFIRRLMEVLRRREMADRIIFVLCSQGARLEDVRRVLLRRGMTQRTSIPSIHRRNKEIREWLAGILRREWPAELLG